MDRILHKLGAGEVVFEAFHREKVRKGANSVAMILLQGVSFWVWVPLINSICCAFPSLKILPHHVLHLNDQQLIQLGGHHGWSHGAERGVSGFERLVWFQLHDITYFTRDYVTNSSTTWNEMKWNRLLNRSFSLLCIKRRLQLLKNFNCFLLYLHFRDW